MISAEPDEVANKANNANNLGRGVINLDHRLADLDRFCLPILSARHMKERQKHVNDQRV